MAIRYFTEYTGARSSVLTLETLQRAWDTITQEHAITWDSMSCVSDWHNTGGEDMEKRKRLTRDIVERESDMDTTLEIDVIEKILDVASADEWFSIEGCIGRYTGHYSDKIWQSRADRMVEGGRLLRRDDTEDNYGVPFRYKLNQEFADG